MREYADKRPGYRTELAPARVALSHRIPLFQGIGNPDWGRISGTLSTQAVARFPSGLWRQALHIRQRTP